MNQVRNQVRNKVRTGPRWTDHGDFSIHYNGTHNKLQTAHIQTHLMEEPDLNEGQRVPHIDPEHPFNDYQYFLYRRALHGLGVYSVSEVEHMNPEKKDRIIKKQRLCAEVLNLYKQELLIMYTNKLLRKYCYNSSFLTSRQGITHDNGEPHFSLDLLDKCEPRYYLSCDFTFKELGVTKKMIAGRLIEKNVLPARFFELTIKDDPRYRKLAVQETL